MPVALVVLTGVYDLSRRPELEQQLDPASAARMVILDMREVVAIDSSALWCFLALKERMSRHGPGVVRLVGVPVSIRRVLDFARLTPALEIHESIRDALGAPVGSPPGATVASQLHFQSG
jgi:anti-anti-sigma factor